MQLTEKKIRELISGSSQTRKSKSLRDAIDQHNQLLFHTEKESRNSAYRRKFMDKSRSLLSKDNFETFEKLVGFPVDTVATTTEIYQCLKKVFDGVDPAVDFGFNDKDKEDDARRYAKEIWGYPNGLRSRLYNTFMYGINNVYVVDSDEGGNPVFYEVPVSNITDFEDDGRGGFEYIIYQKGDGVYCAIDSSAYHIFRFEQNTISDYSSTPHNLGSCPARWFWSVKQSDGVTAKSPLSAYLGKIDDLLFDIVSFKYAKLGAGYPIHWLYEGSCDYEDGSHKCSGGYLTQKNEGAVFSPSSSSIPCPACSKGIGVGTLVKAPFPNGDDIPELKQPVGRLDADVKSIKMLREDLEKLERYIYVGITNDVYNPTDYEAMNETQVLTLFDSAQQTLLDLQKPFQDIEEWLMNMMFRIKYGKDFGQYTVSYGTKHFVFSADVLLSAYKKGVEASLADTILDAIYMKYLESQYRENPGGYRRARIMFEIEPFRHLTRGSVMSLVSQGIANRQEAYLKLNFSYMISLFERKHKSLKEFGLAADSLEDVIDKINDFLYKQVELKVPTITNKNDKDE